MPPVLAQLVLLILQGRSSSETLLQHPDTRCLSKGLWGAIGSRRRGQDSVPTPVPGHTGTTFSCLSAQVGPRRQNQDADRLAYGERAGDRVADSGLLSPGTVSVEGSCSLGQTPVTTPGPCHRPLSSHTPFHCADRQTPSCLPNPCWPPITAPPPVEGPFQSTNAAQIRAASPRPPPHCLPRLYLSIPESGGHPPSPLQAPWAASSPGHPAAGPRGE